MICHRSLCNRCRSLQRYSTQAAIPHRQPLNPDEQDAMTTRLTQLENGAIHSSSSSEEKYTRKRDALMEDENRILGDSLDRMRCDTNRLTYASTSYTPIAMPSTGANFARMDKRTEQKMRVSKARESVSIHRTKKEFQKSKEYLAVEEAFHPMPNSLEGLQSLAEERINEARRNGAFKNLSGKGKKLLMEETKTPMVDRTEFFLNQILKSQGALPPVVEGLNNLDRSIQDFRASIRMEWVNFCCRLIAFSGDALELQVERAKAYGMAEEAGVDRLRDANWEKRELPFINAQVAELNSKTMSVNVIAPYNCRRGYLKVDDELQACYKQGTPLVAKMLIDRARAPKLKDSAGYKRTHQHTSILDHMIGKSARSEFYESYGKSYGFGAWVRETFGKKEPQRSLY